MMKSNNNKTTKLTVSFDNNTTIHELVPHVPISGFDDGDHDEITHTFWFNKDDFKRKKEADRSIVRKIRVGAPFPREARGLEARSPIAIMEKRLAKMDGIAAVLGEQSRQKDLGQRDEESIRNRYVIATKDLVAEAIARASKDAEDAKSEWDGDSPRHTNATNNSCKNSIGLHRHNDACHSSGTYEKDASKQSNKSCNSLGTRKSWQLILSRASQVMKRQEPVK